MGTEVNAEVEGLGSTKEGSRALDSLACVCPQAPWQLCEKQQDMQRHLKKHTGNVGSVLRMGGLTANGVGMTTRDSLRSAWCAMNLTIHYDCNDKSGERLKGFLKECCQPESIAGRVVDGFSQRRPVDGAQVIRVRGGEEMPVEPRQGCPSRENGFNAFEILDVDCGMTREEISSVWRQGARNKHPDKKDGTDDKMQEWSSARDLLLEVGGIEREWYRWLPAIRPGEWVRLDGLLQQQELNGKCGRAVEWNGRRMLVQVGSDHKLVRACNLHRAPDPSTSPHAAAAAAAGLPTERRWNNLKPCPGRNGDICPNEAWIRDTRWHCKTCM